jgi:hypothetical protein
MVFITHPEPFTRCYDASKCGAPKYLSFREFRATAHCSTFIVFLLSLMRQIKLVRIERQWYISTDTIFNLPELQWERHHG